MPIFTFPDVVCPLVLALALFVFTIWEVVRKFSIHFPNLWIALVVPSIFTALAIRYIDSHYALPNPSDTLALRILLSVYLYLIFFLGSANALKKISWYKERRLSFRMGLFMMGWLWIPATISVIAGLFGMLSIMSLSYQRLLTPDEVALEQQLGLTFLFGILFFLLCTLGESKYAQALGVEPDSFTARYKRQ